MRENSARLTPPDEIPLIAVFLRHLAAYDPGAVLAFANESLARSDRAVIVSAAINALLENNWPTLAQSQVELWARDAHAAAIGPAPFQAVAWRLAHESDRAAADWLGQLPASAERDAAFAGTAANWAEHDPDAALAWAGELANDDVRGAAMVRAVRVWADHDPIAAVDWLLNHEALPDGDRLIAGFLGGSQLAHTNPKLALQWATLVRDPVLRERSFAGVLEKWREVDAPAASRFLEESSGPVSP